MSAFKADMRDAVIDRRRLRILQALYAAPSYLMDEVVLQNHCASLGLPVSVDDLREDLKFLRDRECLVLQTAGGVWLAELSRTGGDIVMGVKVVEGVGRPGPGGI